jgi:dipeptidyl-peptidase-4
LFLSILIATALEAQELTLDRVAGFPNLSGTAPISPEWSDDGSHIAFLWNENGMPFRDLYVVAASGEGLLRITSVATEQVGVSDFAWAPGGESLFFSFAGGIHEVRADGTGLERRVEPPGGKSSLAFSPDGRILAFLSEGDLYLWHRATQDLVRATKVARPRISDGPLDTCCGPGFSRPDVELTSISWSPDSRRIALSYADRSAVRTILIPDYLGEETRAPVVRRDYPGDNDHVRDLAVYSVTEGRFRRLELPDATDRSVASFEWSRDGSKLLVDQYPQSAKHRWIFLVDADTGAREELWHDHRATRTTQNWVSAFSSDGRSVYFVTDVDGRHHLYELGLADKSVRRLTEGEWSVVGESGPSSLSVSGASKTIFFVSNQKNPYERHVMRLSEDGGAPAAVTTLEGVHFPYPSPDGSRVALLRSSDDSPTELYVASLSGPEKRITKSTPPEFDGIPWVKPRYVTFPSHLDGVTLHGRLFLPPNLDESKKYPVILGPVYPNSVRKRWGDRQEWRGLYSSFQQYLTIERGFIGFQVDVRGSVGYGREFREKLLGDYGGIDIEDLESGVRYLETLGYADTDRVGIWGSSYGGLMTAMSLFKKPGVYKAGVAAAPATNVRHAMTGQVNVAGRPNTQPDVYRKTSAGELGQDLQDALLIVHGMQDGIVLFKDSVVLAEKLMMLGKDFDMVMSPSSVHEWSVKPYVARHVLGKIVSHFERNLGGGPRPALTVDRIASLPRLSGTPPSSPVWSKDSRRLAFLWNDAGLPFKDLWIAAADGSGLARVTDLSRMRQDIPEAPPLGSSFEELRRKTEARLAPGISEARFTPDGNALVFVFSGDLYRASVDGKELVRLTEGGGLTRSLGFSPNSMFLSYLRNGDLWLWNQKTNWQVQATSVGVLAKGVIASDPSTFLDAGIVSYRWSNDGATLALEYENRERVRKMLFPDYLGEETTAPAVRRDLPGENDAERKVALYRVAEGRLRFLDLPETHDRRIASIEWSPDGKLVLVDESSEDAEDRYIYLFDSETGARREIFHSHFAPNGSTTSASTLWTSTFRSDGKAVLFVSDRGGRHHLWSVGIDGGEPTAITSGDFETVGPAYEGSGLALSRAAKKAFFVSTKKSPYERQVYQVPEGGGEVSQITSLPGTHAFTVSPDGTTLALLHSSDLSPPELYVSGIGPGAGEKRITTSPLKEFSSYEWIAPSYVTFESHVDGATLHGRLIAPRNPQPGKKYPAVLGPVYSNTVRNKWDERFSLLQQHLAMEGEYYVLLVDIRGSVGYGRDFLSKLVGNIGDIDVEDLVSGVRYLESLESVDPDRIGVWGWSYGGLLAAMSLFKKPGVYQAGIAGAPATNVRHATTGEVDLFGRPEANPEIYRKGSAVEFAENLKDPLLVIHGMQDTTVLFQDSINLAEKLMQHGKDFDLVPLPSSLHDGTRKDYTAVHLMRKIVQFFDRHLGQGPR